MDDSFELLEQRVQKAAARLRELKAENAALRAEVQAASARADKAERAARAAAQQPAGAGDELARAQAAARELTAEREQIRARIARLLELLERLE
jgi:hypothetical protein